jgi:uncharacterized protein with FMN-binding domain
MRRIALWLASTVTIVVLLFGYHTSTNKTAATAAPSSSTTSSGASATSSSSAPSSSSTPSSAPSSSSPSPSTSPSSTAGAAKTYTGSVAQTRWGPVQVEVTVAGDTITKVSVLQQPNGNPKDVEINDYALPILVQDTLDSQSADIDMVSGATITSDGYLESLQAALDEAGR